MQIRTRFSISADGYVTTPDGWPPLVRDRQFVSGQSHGFPEFQEKCEAVLMGRTTFEPALTNDRWPWPNLDVFVLGSDVPTDGAPVPIVADSDPARLLGEAASDEPRRGRPLVGGVRTIETFRALGALTSSGSSCSRSSSEPGCGSPRRSAPTRSWCWRRRTRCRKAPSRSFTPAPRPARPVAATYHPSMMARKR